MTQGNLATTVEVWERNKALRIGRDGLGFHDYQPKPPKKKKQSRKKTAWLQAVYFPLL